MNHCEQAVEKVVDLIRIDHRHLVYLRVANQVAISSLSEILCVRHSMSTRSMNATQDKNHRYGGPGGAAAIPDPR
ncbi:hypothetical protein PRZ01_18905, partial [Paucibacter sp. hw1]